MRKGDIEFQHQKALFDWARNPAILRQYPELALLEGSMNGVHLSKAQAGKAKAAGMLTGAHDIRLPVGRGGYYGLSIELKVGKNKPTQAQIDYGQLLLAQDWLVCYLWGWEACRDKIIQYMELAPNESILLG